MKKITKNIQISVLAGFLVATFMGVLAATPSNALPASSLPLTQFAACAPRPPADQFLGLPRWDSCLPKVGNEIQLRSLMDLYLIAFPVIEIILRIAGFVAIGLVIWGGIKYVKSQGDPGQIGEAKSTITNALIGLVICVLSVALVQFIAGAISA